MAEEKKKSGFWTSLFGRNKNQQETKIEPIIETVTVENSTASEPLAVAVKPSAAVIAPEAMQNIAVEEAEIEPEIDEEIKCELQPTTSPELREKPSEGGFFSRLVKGLLKTKQNIGAGFRSLFLGKKIDNELFEELEEQLLIADIGVPTTSKIIKNLIEP